MKVLLLIAIFVGAANADYGSSGSSGQGDAGHHAVVSSHGIVLGNSQGGGSTHHGSYPKSAPVQHVSVDKHAGILFGSGNGGQYAPKPKQQEPAASHYPKQAPKHNVHMGMGGVVLGHGGQSAKKVVASPVLPVPEGRPRPSARRGRPMMKKVVLHKPPMNIPMKTHTMPEPSSHARKIVLPARRGPVMRKTAVQLSRKRPVYPKPVPKRRPAYPKPVPKRRPVYPKPVPKPRPAYPKPVPNRRPVYPKPGPKRRPAYPKPVPKPRPVYPKHVPERRPAYPKPVPKPRPVYPKHVPERRPAYPKPVPKPMTPVYKGGHSAHGNSGVSSGGHGYFPSPAKYGFKRPPTYQRVANVAPLRASGGCPHGWLPYSGRCYYFSRDKMGWFEASMKCNYMGGYLAVANSAHENSYLKLMAGKYNMKPGVWFGLNDVLFQKTHTWYWGYGTKQCKWFDWYGKEPIFGKGGLRHCVALWCSYKYQWRVQKCNSKQYYVCELNPSGPCKCGY